MSGRSVSYFGVLVLLVAACAVPAHSAIEVLDAAFRADRMLPEFYGFWKTYGWGDSIPNCYVGGALAVYVKNTGTGSVTVSDFTINGTGLANGIGCKTDKTYRCDQYACSVYYPSRKQALIDAGEPIWWRVEPNPIPAGGTAEIFVRMRFRVVGTLSCAIVAGSTIPVTINVTANDLPRVAGYGLSPDSTKLYLYLRHPTRGKLPTQILVDGVDKTAASTIAGDPNYDLVPVAVNLGSAFARGSFHCFQAVYDDGTKASDGCRVYYDNFKHGVWGGPSFASDEEQHQWFHNLERHSINLQKGGQGGWYKTSDGRAHLAAAGFKFLHEDPSTPDLYSIFLCDEPDAGEGNVPTSVSPYQVGALASSLNSLSQSFKANYSQYPTNLNLNGSFKPYNYYVYGHVPDVFSVDPYYQTRIADSYWEPSLAKTMPWYRKATYIYAVASTCQAACEPGRLHVILNSCRKHQNDEEAHRVFRWAAPEEKRIEFYYALAAGAKEIAYWWMTPVSVNQDAFCGIGWATEPGSAALWREIGLLGAEAGTVSQLIVNSCPVKTEITKPGRLWTRALLSGTGTLMLLCVNDDYACTDTGITIRSIDNAEVSLDLPDWINPVQVFEVDYNGIRDVPYSVASGRIQLHLGRVDVTRMIIITGDASLKSTLQSVYSATFGPRVAQIIPVQ